MLSRIFYLYSMQLFSAHYNGRYNIFKKNLNLFFVHEIIKKRASKVAHNRLQFFFSQVRPRIDFSYYMSDSSVSLSVAGLVCIIFHSHKQITQKISSLFSFKEFMSHINLCSESRPNLNFRGCLTIKSTFKA